MGISRTTLTAGFRRLGEEEKEEEGCSSLMWIGLEGLGSIISG